MSKYKIIVIVTYPATVFLLWIWLGGSLQVFDRFSFQAVLHGFVLTLAFLIWVAMVYALVTNFFPKLIIQRKLEKAKGSLGNVANAKLKSYKRNRKANYITLTFNSAGVPVRDWESKREHIQSAVNHTIIEDIGYKSNDYGKIVFRVRKGCVTGTKGDLYDDEL